MNLRITYTLLFALLWISCATKLATPQQADADRMTSKYPGYTLEQLNQGKSLYTTYCGNCHDYASPRSKSESEWLQIVPKMVAKVNKKSGPILDAQAESLILKYVITMGSTR